MVHRSLICIVAATALAAPASAQAAWPGADGRIAYETITEKGLQVRSARLDGRHHRVLATIQPFPGVGFLGATPSWSPDGRRLVYFDPFEGVRVMRADGRRKRTVNRGWMEWPSWTPDGRAVVGTDDRTQPYGFFRRRIGGGGRHIDDDRGGSGGAFARVSPNGRWLVYEHTPWLYRLPIGGGHARRLVRGHAHAWSPDGRRLAYAWNADVFSIRPDGSGRRLLHRGRVDSTVVSIAWSPDGRRLVLVRQTPRDAHDRSDVDTIPARGGRERVRFSSANWIGRIDWQPLPR